MNKRSAWMRVLEAGWKNATSLFLKPEKKLGSGGVYEELWKDGLWVYIPVLDL